MKKALVIVACALAANGVFAQASASAAMPTSPTSPASHVSSTSPAARHQARIDERIAYLHKQLKVTSAQETQWGAFADAMREDGQTMSQLYERRVSSLPNESAVDNMRGYAEITQAHADDVKKLAAAFEPLYASFSPEQKQAADTTFREEMGRPHRREPQPKPHKPQQP